MYFISFFSCPKDKIIAFPQTIHNVEPKGKGTNTTEGEPWTIA